MASIKVLTYHVLFFYGNNAFWDLQRGGWLEYLATSILSMNEKMKCSDSLKKYYQRAYWDQTSLLESILGKVTSTLTIMWEWCCIPVAAEHTFYGHCTLQEPANSLRIEDITAAHF